MSATLLRLPVLVALALSCLSAGAAPAVAETSPVVVRLLPSEDLSLPFWCDWGYDWDERCYRDAGDRLPVGGDADNVWRAALRFSVAAIPRDSIVLDASLTVRHDAVCLGPRKTAQPCPARSYTLDLHPIRSARWFAERELSFGELYSAATLADARRPDWLVWDVTGLVDGWLSGASENNGLLLKLSEAEEELGVGGPKLPSSRFADASVAPVLEVVYLPGD